MLRYFAIYNPGTGASDILIQDDEESLILPDVPYLELNEEDSRLGSRYRLQDGMLVDAYPELTDDALNVGLAAPSVSTEEDLANAKRAAIQQLRDYIENIIESFKNDAAPYEFSTWETQRIEYSEWVKDKDAAIPYCRALSAGRGITLEELMAKVSGKITQLASLQGKQHALETLIESATSEEEIKQYLSVL